MSDVARRTLADLRKEAGMTQGEVAKRMGVNRPRVGQIEQDFPRVRFNVVQAYINALGGNVRFSAVAGLDVLVENIDEDPRGPRDHGYRKKSGADSHPRSGDE